LSLYAASTAVIGRRLGVGRTYVSRVVDLYPHEETASQRPQSDIVESSEDEILGDTDPSGRSLLTQKRATNYRFAPHS
jgi:hypothetical protein